METTWFFCFCDPNLPGLILRTDSSKSAQSLFTLFPTFYILCWLLSDIGWAYREVTNVRSRSLSNWLLKFLLKIMFDHLVEHLGKVPVAQAVFKVKIYGFFDRKQSTFLSLKSNWPPRIWFSMCFVNNSAFGSQRTWGKSVTVNMLEKVNNFTFYSQNCSFSLDVSSKFTSQPPNWW